MSGAGLPAAGAGLARDPLADYGVTSTLARYDRAVEEDRYTLTAGLRSGGRSRYVRVVERDTLRSDVRYAIVEARSAVVVCEGEATAETYGDVRRGEQIGRGDLALPREDRYLFDEEAHTGAGPEIERELQDRLAERLASGVFDCLLGQVRLGTVSAIIDHFLAPPPKSGRPTSPPPAAAIPSPSVPLPYVAGCDLAR